MTEEIENYSKVSPDSIKQAFWSMEVNEVFEALKTRSSGLAIKEATERLKIFGNNTVKEPLRLAKLEIIFNQIKNPLILVLIGAGMITVFIGKWIDSSVIFAAVLINTFLGFWQENKAETVLAFLKTYIRTFSRVRRQNREYEIDASELVPGDIVRISQGDRVPADARLVFANNFETDESVLTGESLPVAKDSTPLQTATALTDRKSMVFGGTLAVGGFADAVITATGENTEFGKIASLVAKAKKEPTPLQKSISQFVLTTGSILGLLIFILFGLGIYFGYGLFEMFFIAVAVAVSAVPEGLPIALTVILAIGVQRIAAKNGIIRKLLAAETLGSISLILTDKTGTLTQAKMELAAALPLDKKMGKAKERDLFFEALLNLDIVIENPEESSEKWRMFGRSLEIALAKGAAKRGVLLPEVFKNSKIVDRLPFSSENKFSAVIFERDSKTRLVLFGAPDVILKFSSLSNEEREAAVREIDQRAFSGERVLGVASREVSSNEKISGDFKFTDLEFKGLITFHDPVRPKVSEAIRKIREAGVKTIIVTGDHIGTAESVARELGMIDGKGAVLTGDDLNHLSKEELANRAGQASVFARVTPEQKVVITKLYKERGEIVALTGDGVNDAPALETADIGIAVGSGTEVAKSAADLVILDDNFLTIVAAIEEGRRILDNVRKVIVYLLSDSLDELFLIGGALVFGLALPLNALQILFVNFFSDSFPAVALAFEKGIDGLGSKPRKLDKNLFDWEVKFLILIIGFLTSALLFVLYFFLLKAGFPKEIIRTFIFASFSTYTLFLAFSMRSLTKSIFSYNPFSNFYLVAGASIGLILTALAIYLPVLQKILDTVALPPLWLSGVLGVGLLNVAAVEVAKWIFRKRK